MHADRALRPHGTNRSVDLAVSADGRPVLGRTYTIEARCGIAVRVEKGQTLSVINPSGHQVCDFWAFAADDAREYLSMAHLHTALGSIFPKVGDGLVSSDRRVLLTLTEDSSPGVHDTLVASCDHARYRELGCATYHDNCADNLCMALAAIGQPAWLVPAPFNIWMNVPIGPAGQTHFAAPVAAPGDRVSFRAEADVIAVMSACPQDLTPVNGVGVSPGALRFVVSAP
ncbi:MAG: urea carboxylase-associated family protein [Pseudomonadota bacterium]